MKDIKKADELAATLFENRLKKMAGDFGEFMKALEANDELRSFLHNPDVESADKSAVLEEAFEDTLDETFLEFLKTIISRGQIAALPAIFESFTGLTGTFLEDLTEEYLGMTKAEIISAVPLEDDVIESIKAKIRSRTGEEIKIETKVDPAIVGGLVIRVGDQKIDASIRRDLERLREKMKGTVDLGMDKEGVR